MIAPLMALILSILGWGVITFSDWIFFNRFKFRYLNIYTPSLLLFAGWGSDSYYSSFIGSI